MVLYNLINLNEVGLPHFHLIYRTRIYTENRDILQVNVDYRMCFQISPKQSSNLYFFPLPNIFLYHEYTKINME